MIYDITLPLRDGIAVWPGDVPFSFHSTMSIRKGDPVNLGSITLSLHAGTHMDAPLHVDSLGAAVDCTDLSACVGEALVVDVSGRSEITRSDLAVVGRLKPERLLLKTGAWLDLSVFPDEVPTISADVPAYLLDCGVKLFGVDVPSVDRVHSKDLPNHKQLIQFGITILESLYLAETPEGIYELTALPLRIPGADGAPVRAILKGTTDS